MSILMSLCCLLGLVAQLAFGSDDTSLVQLSVRKQMPNAAMAMMTRLGKGQDVDWSELAKYDTENVQLETDLRSFLGLASDASLEKYTLPEGIMKDGVVDRVVQAKRKLKERGDKCRQGKGLGRAASPSMCHTARKLVDEVLAMLMDDYRTEGHGLNWNSDMTSLLMRNNMGHAFFRAVKLGSTEILSEQINQHMTQMTGMMLSDYYWFHTPNAWNLLDMDGTGSLTYNEVSGAIGKMGMVWPHGANTFFFMDADHNGLLMAEEVENFLTASLVMHELVPELAQMVNVDGDHGQKSPKELLRNVKAFLSKVVVSPTQPVVSHSVVLPTEGATGAESSSADPATELERQSAAQAAKVSERVAAAARKEADRLSAAAVTEADRLSAARADQVATDIRVAADNAASESTRASMGGAAEAREASAKANAASKLAMSSFESAGFKLVDESAEKKPKNKERVSEGRFSAEVVGAGARAARVDASRAERFGASAKVEVAAEASVGVAVQSQSAVRLNAEHLRLPSDMPQEGMYSKLLHAKSKFEHLGDNCNAKASANECAAGRHVIDALIGFTFEENKRLRSGGSITQARAQLGSELEGNYKKVMNQSVVELAETREGTDNKERMATFSVEKSLVLGATFCVSLNHWLYNHGPFEMLDLDRNKNITYKEATSAIKAMTGGDWPGGRYMFDAMDNDQDGVLSRKDIHTYLRGALFVREYVPEMDLQRPDAKLEQLLFLANQNTAKAVRPKLSMPVKFVVIFSIPVIAYIVHAFFCARKETMAAKPVL